MYILWTNSPVSRLFNLYESENYTEFPIINCLFSDYINQHRNFNEFFLNDILYISGTFRVTRVVSIEDHLLETPPPHLAVHLLSFLIYAPDVFSSYVFFFHHFPYQPSPLRPTLFQNPNMTSHGNHHLHSTTLSLHLRFLAQKISVQTTRLTNFQIYAKYLIC